MLGFVEKRALKKSAFTRIPMGFLNARSAFKWLMKCMGVPRSGGVLLPSYIGWSAHEGSGVFDPVRDVGAPYEFYKITRDLRIDLEDLERQAAIFRPRVVLLIHYFGYPDPNYVQAVEVARRAHALVIEDEAHALFSDLIGRVCGRLGDASFFSLHKMLPLDSGGLALLNNPEEFSPFWGETDHSSSGMLGSLGSYDLAQISYLRTRNTNYLIEKLTAFSAYLQVLRPILPVGVVPQTLPILLLKAPRNEIYSAMNRAGYGVVSLYHTLIEEIKAYRFPDSHWLSERILNLPVHQDASLESLDSMLSHLLDLF